MIIYFFLNLLCAYVIFILEREYNEPIGTFITACYFAIISCTSIGYGDITPKTTAGRFITSFFGMCGILLLSLLVYALQKIMSMSTVEDFSYKYVTLMEINKNFEDSSAFLIQSYWRLCNVYKSRGLQRRKSMKNFSSLDLVSKLKSADFISKIKNAKQELQRIRLRFLEIQDPLSFHESQNTFIAEAEKIYAKIRAH